MRYSSVADSRASREPTAAVAVPAIAVMAVPVADSPVFATLPSLDSADLNPLSSRSMPILTEPSFSHSEDCQGYFKLPCLELIEAKSHFSAFCLNRA